MEWRKGGEERARESEVQSAELRGQQSTLSFPSRIKAQLLDSFATSELTNQSASAVPQLALQTAVHPDGCTMETYINNGVEDSNHDGAPGWLAPLVFHSRKDRKGLRRRKRRDILKPKLSLN